MAQSRPKKRNIILIVGTCAPSAMMALLEFRKDHHKRYRLAIIRNIKENLSEAKLKAIQKFDVDIACNLDSPVAIAEAINPYREELLAATCRAEARIPEFQKVIPHIPYLKTPTVSSLEWCTNKILMRRLLKTYNRNITPKFKVVSDINKATIKKIKEDIGFPLVIKPSGLAQSLLVNIGFHEEELEKTLRTIERKIHKVHREVSGRGEAQILVEQFMEGDMYSVDAFVNSRGKVYFAPMVTVKTGRDIGFDDFFAYRTLTPTLLKKESIEKAQAVATQAIHALGLRSSSAHIEMMRTESGWKIIELGPRLGGFRDTMYRLSYGINLTANDIYIRIAKLPVLQKKVLGYTAVFKYFAKKEGVLTNLTGIKKVQELKSFHQIEINKQVGDRATFAKNGGKSIFNIYLFNKDRSKLFADIRRMEQMIKIETKSKNI